MLKDSFEVFVAETEGKMADLIVFKMEHNYCYIDNIVVAKEERRKGVDKALVMYVEGIAKSKS